MNIENSRDWKKGSDAWNRGGYTGWAADMTTATMVFGGGGSYGRVY